MEYQVLLFYKYVTIDDPKALMERVKFLATKYHLLGRVLVAEEGINATLEGKTDETEEFVRELFKDERLADINVKRSVGTGQSFPKLSVKVRNEIVGTRFSQEEADPRVRTAPRLSPEELKKWYKSQKDFVVVDMRNDYEFESGHFKNSINPGLENSRDLPDVIEDLSPLKEKTVLTVCTGGVRCEKMSAYLLSKGFKDVYQLEEGIHSYMEKYPGEDFLGTLYTFDQRVTMDFGGNREIIGKCKLCGNTTEKYVNCANNYCHLHFMACADCQNTAEGKTCCSEECTSKIVTKTV